jgi:hypothetical protein
MTYVVGSVLSVNNVLGVGDVLGVGSVLDVGAIAGDDSAKRQGEEAHEDQNKGESLHVGGGKTCLSVCCVCV